MEPNGIPQGNSLKSSAKGQLTSYIYIYQLGGYQTNPGGTKILTERKETTREWETGDLHPFALAVYKSEKEAGETMAESIGSQSLCCYLKLQ